MSDSAPKTQKNVPNHGATSVLSASPSARMNERLALAPMLAAEQRGIGERREDRDREDADEPERHELFLVRDRPPAAEAPEVLRVLPHHRTGGRRGDFLARDRRHDARDVDAHAEALVADPVALRQVVGAARAGEDEAAQDEGDRQDARVRELAELA